MFSTFNYTIENNSDSIVLLWFEKQELENISQKIKYYFFQAKGDFNLFYRFIDNLKFKPEVFSTFFKIIEPHSKFNIQIYTDNKHINKTDSDRIFNYLDKHIVVVTDKILKDNLKIDIIEHNNMHLINDRSEFYKSDFIALPLKIFNIK
jgi:hypothetical protein